MTRPPVLTLPPLPALPTRLSAPDPGWVETTDVVVVGSGIAGLTTALYLREAGKRVTVVTKVNVDDGSTRWAQGGIAAVLDPRDSPDAHAADTLAAGAGLSDPAVVRILVTEGPARIRELIRLGAQFDRDPDGVLMLTREGGHHARRVVHAGGDATGAEVQRALQAVVRRDPWIRLYEHAVVVDLLTDSTGRVGGVTLHVLGEGSADGVGAIRADAVVLATGGMGQVFGSTTNPPVATGDGLALALRAGVAVTGLELIQFHPTVLVLPRSGSTRTVPMAPQAPGSGATEPDRGRANTVPMAPQAPSSGGTEPDRGSASTVPMAPQAPSSGGTEPDRGSGDTVPGAPSGGQRPLISEALRGEGAHLVDADGKRFLLGRHELAELAPRDVVAKAIYQAMRAAGTDHVHLDARHLGRDFLTHRFPTIVAACRGAGLDPATQLIPVAPAVHYACGGVRTDRSGRTSVPGLYACGEVAGTGVHGANRLASNSLLECLVFARRIATHIVRAPPPVSRAPLPPPEPDQGRTPQGGHPTAAPPWEAARTALPPAMSAGAGVLRSEASLAECAATLARLAPAAWGRGVAQWELANLVTVACGVVAAAYARQESRGCHWREEWPEPDPAWRGHLIGRLRSPATRPGAEAASFSLIWEPV